MIDYGEEFLLNCKGKCLAFLLNTLAELSKSCPNEMLKWEELEHTIYQTQILEQFQHLLSLKFH